MGSFKQFEVSDRQIVQPYLSMYPGNEGSECSFVNLLIWSPGDRITWCIQDDCLLIHTRPKDAPPCMLMAYAPKDRMEKALTCAIETIKDMNEAFLMRSLPLWYCEMMRAALPDRFIYTREPHLDDYVYLSESLISLTGKKLHQKRNHINKFLSEYDGRYSYEPYTPALFDDCMQVYTDWLMRQDDPAALEGERLSVERALLHADAIGAVGGVLRLDGRVCAFSIGERITSDMALIHIEKADMDIPGLFTMINREFVRNAFADLTFINREEDMGNEGLRRAKRSYQPVRMVEKYSAVLAQ